MFYYKVLMIFITSSLEVVICIASKVYMSTPFNEKVIFPRILNAVIAISSGFFFFVSRYPERATKSEFVQMFFNSHSIWHLFVFAFEYEIYWACDALV